MKIDFFSWISGSLLHSVEIPDDTAPEHRTRVALEIGVKMNLSFNYARLDGASLDGASLVRASLVRARLDGASLDGASLVRARLDGASLVRASLDGARLDGASLDGASLDGASLVRASLDGASLDGASLVRASLDGASLVRASLDGASLDGASLVRASLDGARLRSIQVDVFDILMRARNEVPALLTALRAGRIEGSVYEGECACLVGTIANARNVNYHDLGAGIAPDASRPAERWFLGIRKGDTPKNSQIAKITEGWIMEFMALAGIQEGNGGSAGAGEGA